MHVCILRCRIIYLISDRNDIIYFQKDKKRCPNSDDEYESFFFMICNFTMQFYNVCRFSFSFLSFICVFI
jgi:hypothetical protein